MDKLQIVNHCLFEEICGWIAKIDFKKNSYAFMDNVDNCRRGLTIKIKWGGRKYQGPEVAGERYF
jgi:hypothetical protein